MKFQLGQEQTWLFLMPAEFFELVDGLIEY